MAIMLMGQDSLLARTAVKKPEEFSSRYTIGIFVSFVIFLFILSINILLVLDYTLVIVIALFLSSVFLIITCF